MNNLSASVQFSITLMFADDTKCFKHIKSSADTMLLEQDLNSIFHWSTNNCLCFNASKSVVLKFKLKSPPDEDDNSYHINSLNIANKTIHRDLGVTFSTKFSWRPHYEFIIGKPCIKKLTQVYYEDLSHT